MSDERPADAHRALVGGRFPQLQPIASFEPIEGGWTCHTYRVNGDWIVQLPVDARAEAALTTQLRVLPELAQEVSARVPHPELVATDPPAMGYRLIEGEPVTPGAPGLWPERLGRFLYDLHMVPPEYLGMRAGGPGAAREAAAAELDGFRERGLPLLEPAERDAVARDFDAYLDDDGLWRFAPCVVHRDLGPAHILVTPAGDLAGVIDWEEVRIDDPAIDFAWVLVGSSAEGERALAAYGGPPDPGFVERARFAYRRAPWHDVIHGLETGQERFVRDGLAGVRARLR